MIGPRSGGATELPDPVADPMDSDRPSIEIVSLAWERIQLIIRSRLCSGVVSPASVRLEPSDHPEEATPPTRASLDGDSLLIRFNVMQGPGQLPLHPGRWLLTTELDGRRAPIRIVNPAAVVGGVRQTLELALSRGWFRAAPTADASTGRFVLDVELLPRDSEALPPDRPGLRSGVRRWQPMTELRRRLFLALLGVFEAMTRRDGHQVLFTSDSRADLSGNLKIVHDRMVERGLGRRYRLRTLFKPSVSAGRGWRDRLRLPRLLAGSDVILLDDYQPIIYRFTPPVGVRVIQLWHASGAFKTVGYSRVGKPGGPSPYSMTHKNYTHAIVSSNHDVPYYAEAFGIPEERVVPTGIPRMDRFFDEQARTAGRASAHAAFPEIGERMAILFAPTFRGSGPRSAFYDIDLVDFAALHALCVEKDAVAIIRMHPFVREALAIPPQLGDRLLDGSRGDIDVNDLLFGVDLLITDYSSIVFEYSTLGRPMLFFAYDLEEYVATRDFYVPFEEFVPGRIVRTFDELLDAIRHDDYQVEKVAAFAGRHFEHLDGMSADRVIDELILAR